MANRRMFSLKIVDSDAFIDMPQSTQLLYFHLSMRADDDGFVGNPKKIMRMIGSNDDDYKVLISKRFIIVYESGVMVIKHWKMHNYIQTDRYQETQYLDEKKRLYIKPNGAYTENPDECIQIVSNLDTQDRDRIGKDRIDTTYTDDDFKYDDLFTSFWNAYPKKTGKGAANKSWKKLKPSKAMTEKIVASVVEHSKTKQWQKENGQFIPNPTTFLNQRRWEDEINEGASASSRDPKYNSVNVRSA